MVGVLLGGAIVLLLWRRPVQPSATPIETLVANARYVGDGECRACHEAICDSYARTGMGRAWYRPTATNIIEDYSRNNHAYDAQRDLHYQMLARDGRFFQREYRLDAAGAVVHELEREATYIVGSGEHVRSYINDTNGFLTELPISWYVERRTWDLSPGYRRFNHRFDRPILPLCAGCHTNYPQHVPHTLNRFEQPVPSGIGCERCHGPAEWHVKQQKDGWVPPGGAEVTMVNPAKLPTERANDVCFQCHLQADSQFPVAGKHPFAFKPGLKLSDYQSYWLAETPDPASFGIASHAARMVLSRCYTASGNKLTCVTCHDPHVPYKEVSRETERQNCLKCHSVNACSRPPVDAMAKAQQSASVQADHTGDCIACHMPRGQPADVQHTVFTDHWIQRKPMPRATNAHPAATPAREPVRLKSFWADQRSSEEEEGIAYLVHASANSQPASLLRGATLLRKAQQRGSLHPESWRRLGLARFVEQDYIGALQAFQAALTANPNDAEARLGLGMTLKARQESTAAVQELSAVVQQAPDQLDVYRELAALHVELRQPHLARDVLQAGLKRNPWQPIAWANLGGIYCHLLKDPAQGLAAYREALRLDPDHQQLRLAFAQVLLEQNQPAEAEKHIGLVLRINPRQVPALVALAQVQLAQKRTAEARLTLQRVLQLDPRSPAAHSLLRTLPGE